MARGGLRKRAGRPSSAEDLSAKVFYYRRKGTPVPTSDDEGMPSNPQEIRKLIRDIRKRASGGGAAVVTNVGTGYAQSTINYAITHSLYEDWPLVKSAVDWAIDTALENGYRIESDNPEAKQLCDRLGEVLKLDTVVLPRWIHSLHIDGNIFDEIRWGQVQLDPVAGGTSYTAPTQFFPIPAGEMRYKWKDTSGQEVVWAQITPTGTPKDLDPLNLIVEAWRPEGYNPFGTPIISSVIDDVETLLNFETDYNQVMKWYVKPLWHVMVGTPDKPASDTLLASVKGNWEIRQPNTDLITAGNVKIETHGLGTTIPPLADYLGHHDAKQVDGLQTPFIHVLKNASQASASEIRDNTLSRVVFLQLWLKRELEAIFQTVLVKNNLKAKIRVVFQPLRAITLKDKVTFYIELLNPQKVQLSDQTRLEVEQKLRMELLSLPRDDTLQQNIQPMPGHQGLLGKVKQAITGKQTAVIPSNAPPSQTVTAPSGSQPLEGP